jgi:ATP-dependent Lhr-like helicase
MLFLTTDEPSLWRACGLTRLWSQGRVEAVAPPPLPVHLVAHQLLALVLQEGAVGRRLWREWLGDPFVFGDDVALFDDAVADHLTGHGFVTVDGGMLSVGREAEARFGRRNFLGLTSVFTAPPVFAVLAGRREIGHVHDLGIMAAFQVRDGPPVLLLGGRGWRILDVDWRRRRIHVELTDRRGKTRYHGVDRPLDHGLCQSIADVLAGDDPSVALSQRAQSQLDDSRAEFPGLRPAEATVVRRQPTGQTEWWTFAGLKANLELAARLGPLTRSVAGIDDLSIALTDDTSSADLAAALDRQTPVADLLDLTEDVVAGVKFADCLPDWLADAVVLARVDDAKAVGSVLARRVGEAVVG